METAPGISFLFNILKLAVLMLFFINLWNFQNYQYYIINILVSIFLLI